MMVDTVDAAMQPIKTPPNFMLVFSLVMLIDVIFLELSL